jgi:mRNA-degrading endonuclease RelE of RelBE toxin-antitoxin system
MNTNNQYQVKWTRTATNSFAKLFNIDHLIVASKAKTLLENKPLNYSYGAADYPNFKYNGYYWTEINNVILVYSINEEQKKVRIRLVILQLPDLHYKHFMESTTLCN